MKDSVPQYTAPQPDPGLALLAQQNEQQKTVAIQDRVSAASAALMQRYGTRVAMAPLNGTPIAPLLAASSLGMSPLFQIDPAPGAGPS